MNDQQKSHNDLYYIILQIRERHKAADQSM